MQDPDGQLVFEALRIVKYHRPVPIGKTLYLKGALVEQKGRIFDTEGVLADDRGNTLTSATGRYVELTGAMREKLMQSLGSNS